MIPEHLAAIDDVESQSVAQIDNLLDLLLELQIIKQAESPVDVKISNEKTSEPLEDWRKMLPPGPHLLALPPAKEQPEPAIADDLVLPIETKLNEHQISKSDITIIENISEDETNLDNLFALILGEQNLSESQFESEKTEVVTTNLAVKPARTSAGTLSTEEDPFKLLQSLLVEPEVSDVRDLVAYIDEKVANIEYQLYQPQELLNLLLPIISELLSRKVSQSKEEVVEAIAPIIDRVIQNRSEQDKAAMSAALAPIISDAISRQITNAPEEIATAIGPTMGKAIKEQIRLEQDAMVDALYPVIGNTIAKYMAEAIRSINDKIKNAFSVEGIQRKISAKVQGVSEAELIFREVIPFEVRAIFLIQKTSGLVISEVQPSESQRLESEMVAGMLTAIRSFVNDCIAQTGEVSELNEIEYGSSKIILEVAGYCYLAVVIQGEPPKPFIQKMRQTLSTLILKYGNSIEFFDGDPDKVPERINSLLQSLISTESKDRSTKPPTALLILSSVILSLIIVPWGFYQYRNEINRRIEIQATEALASTPELAIYRLSVDADRDILKLTGKVPNQHLRSKAAEIVRALDPNLKLDNQILAVEVPPDPVLTNAEVKRVTKIFERMNGITISTQYKSGKVTVAGSVREIADARKITQALATIPGVISVTNTVQIQPLKINLKIYFDPGSAQLISKDFGYKINQVKDFLERYPEQHLKIIGHSELSDNPSENRQLALERAKAVQNVLVSQGIDSQRMQIAAETTRIPQNQNDERPLWLNRYVRFEPFTPFVESQ